MKTSKIAVLDFGGQYTHLIARRIRQLKVYSEILNSDENEKKLEGFNGIIFSGGPHSVFEETAPEFNKKILDLRKPILGICYGHQLLAKELGGKVEPGKVKEYGSAELKVKENKLFKGLKAKEKIWMSHGDEVLALPQGFQLIGETDSCKYAAMASDEKKIYGVQFHPEVTHTRNGMKILENFLFKVCRCSKSWSIENFLEQKIQEIKQKAENKKVFLLASGGVDSTVCLALLSRALGNEKVYSLHINNGFMRKNESKFVEESLKKINYGNFHIADYSDFFFQKISKETDPEKKRKIIGEAFLEAKDLEIKKIGLNEEEWILAQGTIYPDTIESGGTKHASKIKTHHNRVDKILEMIKHGKIIEPIQELYKDEVRELGQLLALPENLINRHPFPGPGLSIRVLGELKENKLENEKETEEKINELINEFNLKAKILPVKSVGVQGDARTYKNPVVLFGELNWSNLRKASNLIANKVPEINRVTFCLTQKNPEKIRFIPCIISKERVSLLREADAVVNEIQEKKDIEKEIWQFPVVLVPVSFEGNEKESIVLRPINSTEAMTANFYEMKKEILNEMTEKLMQLNVSAVLFDLTDKPPGTIEWE